MRDSQGKWSGHVPTIEAQKKDGHKKKKEASPPGKGLSSHGNRGNESIVNTTEK